MHRETNTAVEIVNIPITPKTFPMTFCNLLTHAPLASNSLPWTSPWSQATTELLSPSISFFFFNNLMSVKLYSMCSCFLAPFIQPICRSILLLRARIVPFYCWMIFHYMYISQLVSTVCLVMDMWVVFSLKLFSVKLVWTFVGKSLRGHMLSFRRVNTWGLNGWVIW